MIFRKSNKDEFEKELIEKDIVNEGTGLCVNIKIS